MGLARRKSAAIEQVACAITADRLLRLRRHAEQPKRAADNDDKCSLYVFPCNHHFLRRIDSLRSCRHLKANESPAITVDLKSTCNKSLALASRFRRASQN